MILSTFLYADGTVAGLYRFAVTVLEVVEDLDGVLRRALLEVEVVSEIRLIAVLGTQKRDDSEMTGPCSPPSPVANSR